MQDWKNINIKPLGQYTFKNYVGLNNELIQLRNDIIQSDVKVSLLHGNKGSGVTHLLNSYANYLLYENRKVFYITAQWLIHINKELRTDKEVNDFLNFILSNDFIVIDNTQCFYKRSVKHKHFIYELLKQSTHRGKNVLLGCSLPERDFTKTKEFKSLFDIRRVQIRSSASEMVFKMLKGLCTFEDRVPDKLLYLISGYNGSAQQYINCLISIRFKSRVENIDLTVLSLEELERSFKIKSYFPKQQFRRTFMQGSLHFIDEMKGISFNLNEM